MSFLDRFACPPHEKSAGQASIAIYTSHSMHGPDPANRLDVSKFNVNKPHGADKFSHHIKGEKHDVTPALSHNSSRGRIDGSGIALCILLLPSCFRQNILVIFSARIRSVREFPIKNATLSLLVSTELCSCNHGVAFGKNSR